MIAGKVTVNTKEAAAYLGVSVGFMKRSRSTGKGVAFVTIGRRVVYLVADLDKFLNDNKHINLSAKK